MQARQLPFCCGADLFSDFGNTPHATNKTAYTTQEVEQFIVESERYSATTRKAMVILTLNDHQMEKLGHIFKAKGYKVVSKGYHYNHDSVIFLLVKVLKPADEKRVRKVYRTINKK